PGLWRVCPAPRPAPPGARDRCDRARRLRRHGVRTPPFHDLHRCTAPPFDPGEGGGVGPHHAPASPSRIGHPATQAPAFHTTGHRHAHHTERRARHAAHPTHGHTGHAHRR